MASVASVFMQDDKIEYYKYLINGLAIDIIDKPIDPVIRIFKVSTDILSYFNNDINTLIAKIVDAVDYSARMRASTKFMYDMRACATGVKTNRPYIMHSFFVNLKNIGQK